MNSDVLDGERRNLFGRVRALLLRPQSEWRRIGGEEPAPLLGGYVMPLALAGGVVGLASSVAYARFALKPALAWTALVSVLYVVFAVVAVIAAGALIKFLLRRFGAEADGWRAKQLAAYAATPVLVAAMGAVIPSIAPYIAAIAAIYALALLAMGVSQLAPLPDPENSVPRFTLTFAAAALVLGGLTAAFIAPLLGAGREALLGAVQAAAPAAPAPDIERRSAAELAIDRLAQSDGSSVLVDPSRLEQQFPDSLPSGFQRESVATAQGGGVSRADGVYRKGEATLRVSIIQFSSRVDPAAFATLLAIKPDGAQENGYARTQSIDARLFAEDASGATSRYIVIGRGVVMAAEGEATMDQARAAIDTIDLHRLEAMFAR